MRPEFKATFKWEDLLDYQYCLSHTNTYKDKYQDFLNADFKYLPLPKDADAFWVLVALGKQAFLKDN